MSRKLCFSLPISGTTSGRWLVKYISAFYKNLENCQSSKEDSTFLNMFNSSFGKTLYPPCCIVYNIQSGSYCYVTAAAIVFSRQYFDDEGEKIFKQLKLLKINKQECNLYWRRKITRENI